MPNAESLRFDIVGPVLLVVHADMAPEAEDWSRLRVVREANRDKLRGTLVIAPPRAKLSASQRSDVAQYMKVTGASTAVVTDSALVRGVARAIGFLGVPVRAFAPIELESALNFLSVPSSRHAELLRRVDVLRAQLSISQPPPMTLSKGA